LALKNQMDEIKNKISVNELREILNEPNLSIEDAEFIIDSVFQLSWIAIDSISK